MKIPKRIMIAAVAVFAMSAPLAAFAAPPKTHKAQTHKTSATNTAREELTSGVVAAYAADTRMLKLSAGEEFKLAPSITTTNFKSGDKVTVSWTMKNGARLADKVQMK